MKTALARQPLSAAVCALGSDFVYYESGVLNDIEWCPGDWVLNHSVLITGWGHDSESGLDYWMVKNSWGTGYGEKGYIRLAIVDDYGGMCGIHRDVLWAHTNY